MSLFSLYYFLLLLLINISNSNSFSYKDIYTLCTDEKNNILNDLDGLDFKKLVKLNFESFLCDLFLGIYENNPDAFNDITKSDINNDNNDLCLNEIKETFNKSSQFFQNYLSHSGSRLNKVGNEKECIKADLTYYLIEIESNFSEIEYYLNLYTGNKNYTFINEFSQYLELNGFLENNKFYLGLCLWKNCNDFFKSFFNRDKNNCLFEYLAKNEYSAKNWAPYTFKDIKDKSNSKIPILMAIIFISFVIFIRFILYISNYCTGKNQQKELKTKTFILNSFAHSPEEIQLVEQNEENYSEVIENDNKNDNNINLEEYKKYNLNRNDTNFSENNDTETKVSKLNSILTKKKTQAELFLEYYEYISSNNLYKLETKSYNSKKLEEISGFKFILLFFISFYNVYNVFYHVKWNVPGTLSFYQSLAHILLAKFSKMSFRIWIFFDGFQWCFKLLSYIKKLKSKKVNLKHIIIFNINIIEKIIVFIIMLLIFIYQIDSLGFFQKTSSFYLHSQRYTDVICYKNPLYIFILPFMGHNEDIGKHELCYNFVYILVNEFYCIIICSILFYLFFKFQSQFLEYLFLVLFFISILILSIFFLDKYDQLYFLRYVLGEDLSLKSIGLFFHYFFIGCISGLIYYYSTVMNLDLEKYNVFEGCYKYMYCFISMNHALRHFLGFLCFFLILLICSYYPLLFRLGEIEKSRLVKRIDLFTYIVFSYENIIQIILFMFFFFDIILSPELFIKIFLSNDIFIIFERCSFIFLIIIEQVVFLFETLIYLDGIYWNTENIFFLSIICFLITMLLSWVFSFFIQLPVRLYTKIKSRNALENYEKDIKLK